MADEKNIKFTGDPVAFDGVEGKRDPKTGKGRFDLIPTEVYYPLFSKADHDWLLDCHPASILMSIADEKFIEAIIKMTIYSYAEHNEHYAASSSEFWHGVWPMLQDLAIHFQKGAEHYGERNCQKGIPLWSFKDSAMRHATQAFEGKEDEPHKISVIWNCWMAAWTVITSNKKDDAGKSSDKVVNKLAMKILLDRRKNAKKELFKLNSDSPEFKEKKNDIDEMKKFINKLSQLSDELNIPIITAQQTSYTREEVEAIKKEAVDKAIEDFLNGRSPKNFEFSDGKDKWDKLIDEMSENAKEAGIPWLPKDPENFPEAYYDYNRAMLCRCPTDALMRELHKRLTLIYKSEKIVKQNFVTNNREKLTKFTRLIDAIKRCEVDSEVDTVKIQRIIYQLREELIKAHDIFDDTDGKGVSVFFNHLRPAMNEMLSMWNHITPMLLKEKTSEQ